MVNLEKRRSVYTRLAKQDGLTPLLKHEIQQMLNDVRAAQEEQDENLRQHRIALVKSQHKTIKEHWARIYKDPQTKSNVFGMLNRMKFVMAGQMLIDYYDQSKNVVDEETISIAKKNGYDDALRELRLDLDHAHFRLGLIVAREGRVANDVETFAAAAEWEQLARLFLGDKMMLKRFMAIGDDDDILKTVDEEKNKYFSHLSSITDFAVKPNLLDTPPPYTASASDPKLTEKGRPLSSTPESSRSPAGKASGSWQKKLRASKMVDFVKKLSRNNDD